MLVITRLYDRPNVGGWRRILPNPKKKIGGRVAQNRPQLLLQFLSTLNPS